MTTIRLALFLFQTVKRKTMRTMMQAPKMNGNHERWKGSMSNSGRYEKVQSGLKVWANAKRLTFSPGSRYGNDIERTLLHRLLSVLLTCYPL